MKTICMLESSFLTFRSKNKTKQNRTKKQNKKQNKTKQNKKQKQKRKKRGISIFVTLLAKNAILASISLWKCKSTMRWLPPRKYYKSLFCKSFAISTISMVLKHIGCVKIVISHFCKPKNPLKFLHL